MALTECGGASENLIVLLYPCSFHPTPRIYCLGFNVLVCSINSLGFDFYRDDCQDVHARVCELL